MKKIAFFIAAAFLCSGAFASSQMSQKHKFDCSTCHKNGQFTAVQKDQCQMCHQPFKGEPILANGKANPHISMHYLPETVDCNLCHREHSKSQNYCQACHADGLGLKVP